jgi:phosphodiesterase/alkaline phosphatase D-like protein
VTHGPILGRLGAHEVGVWVRTDRPCNFSVRYGTEAGKLDQVSSPGLTRLEHDCSGWVQVSGLKANTRYYYQVVGDPKMKSAPAGPGGSFRTLPDSAEVKDSKLNPRGLFNFRFEFACGNNQNAGQGGGPDNLAFKTMLAHLRDQIHFAILNGDWLYEDKREHSVEEWLKQVGIPAKDAPDIVRKAPTIAGVWENYKQYLSASKNLSDWHRNIPSFFTFDDHEILNDVWGAGSAGLRDRRAVFRDIGVRAWYDYLGWSNPVKFTQPAQFGQGEMTQGSSILVDPQADFMKLDMKQLANLHVHWGTPTAGVNDNKLDGVGGDPNAGVYDIVKVLDKNRLQLSHPAKTTGKVAYSIGRRNYFSMRIGNCEFIFLDTRSHRQMHDTRQPDKAGLTMLGAEQKQWVIDVMKNSDADFFFVVSSVNFMVPHVGGGAVRAENKDDAWTVFLEEREFFIRFWDGLNRPVFVLTGDLHNSFAVRITDRVWEFASGPHNSQNHRVRDEDNRPANGPFHSRGRVCDIRWSSYFLDDIPREELRHPLYCVVQVNNVFNNPLKVGEDRWVAFPRPQVIFQYYDGRTGELRYAEAIAGTR